MNVLQGRPTEERVPGQDRASDFDAFYGRTAPGLVRQLHAMTGDLGDAQDCVQEAFARAWQRWDRLKAYDAPDAWVRTVAWRLAVSRFRRVLVGRGALRREGPPPDVAPPGPEHVALVAALKQIPEAQRRAIVLHHLGGLSVDEVAAETGSSSGTVKARLARGRAALAELLVDGPDGPDTPDHSDPEGARRG
jgi:RNA polymerase sigma-70 factor (ECF subfamily)